MGFHISEDEHHLIELLASDELFSANAVVYRQLLRERARREDGDKNARPRIEIEKALDETIAKRRQLPLVVEKGADVRTLGLAYQRVIRDVEQRGSGRRVQSLVQK